MQVLEIWPSSGLSGLINELIQNFGGTLISILHIHAIVKPNIEKFIQLPEIALDASQPVLNSNGNIITFKFEVILCLFFLLGYSHLTNTYN